LSANKVVGGFFMGIKVEKMVVIFSSVTMMPIVPVEIFPGGKQGLEERKEYLKENPFPATDKYTESDLLYDTFTGGMWTLSDNVTEEQIKYIIEFTEHFL
jgi:hypothetical protein